MTTPALIRKSDLKRMAEFVSANPGLRVELERDGVIIRVATDNPSEQKKSVENRAPIRLI